MSVCKRPGIASVISSAILLAGFSSFNPAPLAAETPGPAKAQLKADASRPVPVCEPSVARFPIHPRRQLGLSSGLPPLWSRLRRRLSFSICVHGPAPVSTICSNRPARALKTRRTLHDPTLDQAEEIYKALDRELHPDTQGPCRDFKGSARIESIYTAFLGISGTPLHDSFHLGQTVINNYGRPYQNGFNNYTGISGYASAGRFLVYARGEFQAAPSATGYSTVLARTTLGSRWYNIHRSEHRPALPSDRRFPWVPSTQQPTPASLKPTSRQTFSITSFRLENRMTGSGLAWAADLRIPTTLRGFYSFRINRVEPLHIPGLSYVTGPFRYEFMIGGLHGHTYVPNPAYPGAGQPNVINPGDPWMHLEKISFRPTENLEFGFQRTVIWGGEGHGPITLHTFLKSFFSLSSPTNGESSAPKIPAHASAPSISPIDLPFLRKWLTLYTDGEVHDDVSPIDAPRRAAWRPGLYLSHVPGVPKLDVRAEAVYTDPPVSTSQGGRFMYWELFRGRATPTMARSLAIGSAAKPRADKPGSPGTSAATSGFRPA